MDDILKETYAKYTSENLLKEYSDKIKKSKKNTGPVFSRIEFNQHVKCQKDKCVKIACFSNLNDSTNICWFHALTLND